MKKIFTLCIFSFLYINAFSQKLFNYPDSIFPTYWHQRASLFKALPQTDGDIIFLGNSITDGGEWSELFGDSRVKNRGISGDITAGILNRIDEVINRKPKKVFLLIGVNDLSRNISQDSVLKNLLLIAKTFKQYSPSTKLYIQSILPVNDAFRKFNGHVDKGENVQWVNARLKDSANNYGYTFVDIHSAFKNAEGKLDKAYTNDGLHLTGAGYEKWKQVAYPYLKDLQAMPSLIPMPKSVVWGKEAYRIVDFSVVNAEPGLSQEKEYLEKRLIQEVQIPVFPKLSSMFYEIKLRLNKLQNSESTDAYKLIISGKEINILAKSREGIFYGIQTLLQLIRGGTVPECEIYDEPAFAFRGFMTDAGRNYQSMAMLKQMIDAMAMYKLNIFHFHPTEDVAWRIAIKQYPQLTAPEHMLRNKGMYYTEADIKELIRYCKERQIEFVPEIDMPGHSAAFKRAMGVDMQSDSGVAILKNVLRELCTTYDFKYLHIGADEVKITNKNFVPEMTAFIESFGKKVIGWEPGGNFTNSTIRQMWMDDNGKVSSNHDLKFIDSRHLYLNHMDPLEAVTTIFYRKIGNKEKGDSSLLGATLCLWPDRAVNKDEDILRMNPVYLGIATFAERVWNGGGIGGWVSNISDADITSQKAFADFEARLLDHKKQYFSNKSFPYQKQAGLSWDFYGPYNNKGDVSQKFINELYADMQSKKIAFTAEGGTIVLRHWWANLIKGAVPNAEDSTTWFATSSIWANEAGFKDFWIGFNNISRSPATDSPPAGVWDEKQGKVWVNGMEIAPPAWQRPGRKGNSEEPLLDEGYEYRTPTKIYLKQGWNQVLVKCPIASFKGKNWQNPVKWMFTFVEVE